MLLMGHNTRSVIQYTGTRENRPRMLGCHQQSKTGRDILPKRADAPAQPGCIKERIDMANHIGGLHDRLNRISHWDVNVTDLGRSRSWYEATTTLRVVAQT